MVPSIKRLQDHLGIAREQAVSIRRALQTNTPGDALEHANKLLDAHGIECIRDNDMRTYYGDIAYEYVNMGDTYIPTIIFDTDTGAFSVRSIGDVLELKKNERRIK
jgi:hypothetical protein